MSVVGFGVKNLRCLTDTGVVAMKPITLLVGRNSSGKSTFLRALPLLRQSVETPRQSPILWFDPQYVDFGSFDDAVNHKSKQKNITFRFRAQIDEATWAVPEPLMFDVAMTLSESPAGSHVSAYEIQFEDHSAVMEFAADGSLTKYEVDSHNALPKNASLALGGRVVLLATIQSREKAKTSYLPAARKPRNDSAEYEYEGDGTSDVLWPMALAATEKMFKKSSLPSIFTIEKMTPGSIGSYASMLENVKFHLKMAKLENLGKALTVETSSFRKAMAANIAAMLPFVLDALDRSVAEFSSCVTYIAPLRASARRAYRIQELSVEEVNPQGENLPMFLRSLSPEETEHFATFTSTYLDFEIQVRSDRHHAEILIKESGADRFVNLVDVGFGYAEILSFVVTLWSTCVRIPEPQGRKTSIVAIEQPELHLHPAYQARLARMIVGAQKAAREAGRE
jgi:hypothetical protein